MMNTREEHRATLHTYRPDKVATMDRLMFYDSMARDAIKDAENLLAMAREYRLSLARRAKELEAMPFIIRVTLKREKNTWTGKIRYFLWTEKVFEDDTAQKLDESIYEGRDRHKAIAEFRRIQKEFPGYEFVEDIARGKWER